MFRKSMIALATIAALSTTALVSADAFAKPNGGGWGKGGGWAGAWHHHHFGRSYGFYGFGGYEPDCYQIVTRRGFVRTVCSY
jgi:hypothetical protein